MTSVNVVLEPALIGIQERLTARFDRVDPRVVEQTVRQCATAFAGARIRTFVPVFVERQSVERLVALSPRAEIDSSH